MRTHLLLLLVSAVAAIVLATDTNASIRQRKPSGTLGSDNRPTSHFMLGLRTGLLFGGGIDVERSDGPEWSADLNAGFSFGGFLELPSTQWTTAALDINMHRVEPDGMPPAFDRSRWLLDVGVVIKPSIRTDSLVFSLRPVLGISYGRFSGQDGVVSAANFMIVKLGAEALYLVSENFGLSFEALLVAAPYGRASAEGPGSIIDDQNVRYNLSAGLRPVIRIGIAYR